MTIPVNVRYQLGIGPDDEVVFSVEDGRGSFRRAVDLTDRGGSLAIAADPDAHPLVRFLCAGDQAFVATITEGSRVVVADAVLLDLTVALVGAGRLTADAVDVLRDVLASRLLRFQHARALRSAVDAAVVGEDPERAYALACA